MPTQSYSSALPSPASTLSSSLYSVLLPSTITHKSKGYSITLLMT